LTDFKTQESFFKQIQQRYIFHCGSFPDVSSLDAQFSALSVNSNIDDPSRPFVKDVDTSILESILVDMRKLREGLLASKRIDEFTTGVYIFITRAAILMSHSQSYVPSLRYLLYNIHSVRPLSNPEINEFASYLMLHLACSTQAYHDAYEIKTRFRVHDFRAEAVVKSLVTGNYWLFWSTKKLVDGYKARIMEKAEKRIRTDILKVVGKSYMQVDVDFLQNITAREWPILREEFGIGWEEEAKMIYIRRAKTKSTPITSEAAKVAAQKTMNNGKPFYKIWKQCKLLNIVQTKLTFLQKTHGPNMGKKLILVDQTNIDKLCIILSRCSVWSVECDEFNLFAVF